MRAGYGSRVLVVLSVTCCLLPVRLQSAANRDAIRAALRNQEFEKALELLSPALGDSPQDAQLWTMQGVAYAGEKREKEALASFRHALQLVPDYLPALQGAAQIEYDAGSPNAIPLIQHVLRLHPGDVTGHGMWQCSSINRETVPPPSVILRKQARCLTLAPADCMPIRSAL